MFKHIQYTISQNIPRHTIEINLCTSNWSTSLMNYSGTSELRPPMEIVVNCFFFIVRWSHFIETPVWVFLGSGLHFVVVLFLTGWQSQVSLSLSACGINDKGADFH